MWIHESYVLKITGSFVQREMDHGCFLSEQNGSSLITVAGFTTNQSCTIVTLLRCVETLFKISTHFSVLLLLFLLPPIFPHMCTLPLSGEQTHSDAIPRRDLVFLSPTAHLKVTDCRHTHTCFVYISAARKESMFVSLSV